MKPTLLTIFMALFVSQGFLLADNGTKPNTFPGSGEIEPREIIAKYIQAVGGADKVAAIKNASISGQSDFQGQNIVIKTISDAENSRMMQSTSVGGKEVQKTLFVNGKAQTMAMGQVQQVPEEMHVYVKLQTYLFPELNYEDLGFQLVYAGQEELDGQQVHKLEIKAPNGVLTHEYYGVDSGLKVKTSSSVVGEILYSDYQEESGVLIPMKMVVSNPMLPVPMEVQITSVLINSELSEQDFQ